MNNIRRHFSINRSQIAGDIDATASFVRMVQSVILKDRMKRILRKKPYTFIGSFLLRRTHLRIPLVKVAVENYPHGRW
ncbi:MAG: hypothetical protein AAB916_00490 [Patescibacteria group bacterium]